MFRQLFGVCFHRDSLGFRLYVEARRSGNVIEYIFGRRDMGRGNGGTWIGQQSVRIECSICASPPFFFRNKTSYSDAKSNSLPCLQGKKLA
jgi:hypothetical protein